MLVCSYKVLYVLTDCGLINLLIWHKYSNPIMLRQRPQNKATNKAEGIHYHIQISLPQYRYYFMHWKQYSECSVLCMPSGWTAGVVWPPHFSSYLITSVTLLNIRKWCYSLHNKYEDRDQHILQRKLYCQWQRGNIQNGFFSTIYCILIWFQQSNTGF